MATRGLLLQQLAVVAKAASDQQQMQQGVVQRVYSHRRGLNKVLLSAEARQSAGALGRGLLRSC